jgi:tetratricopeptide (TPR) repeat protein
MWLFEECNNRLMMFLLTALFLTPLFVTPVHALEPYKTNYLQGIEYKEKGQCEEAVEAFAKALGEYDKEEKMVRFYGMRYGDYFPHREKGICHYQLKQYRNAVEELEISIRQQPTDAARKYLEMAKRELDKGGQEAVFEIVKTPEELKNPKSTSQERRNAVAVVIGNRNYKDKDIPSVNYAIEDAKLVKEYLIRTFGYREGNIIFEADATKGTFENIFGTATDYKGRLYEYVQPGKSDVFVYYSGHGAPSLETRKGYILPVDGDPNNIAISGYPLDLLYKNLATLPARSLMVVTDACFSGAPIFKKASPVGIIVENPLAAVKNATIINSSSGTELSSWYPEKGHGLFTYYFLLGLSGKADVEGKGKITLGDLTSYLNENVPYTTRKLYQGRKQTPTFTINNPDEILVTYK